LQPSYNSLTAKVVSVGRGRNAVDGVIWSFALRHRVPPRTSARGKSAWVRLTESFRFFILGTKNNGRGRPFYIAPLSLSVATDAVASAMKPTTDTYLQQIFGHHAALLAGAEKLRLFDDYRRIFVKSVSVTAWASGYSFRHDGIASLADLI
jgi:hypothetical protein